MTSTVSTRAKVAVAAAMFTLAGLWALTRTDDTAPSFLVCPANDGGFLVADGVEWEAAESIPLEWRSPTGVPLRGSFKVIDENRAVFRHNDTEIDLKQHWDLPVCTLP